MLDDENNEARVTRVGVMIDTESLDLLPSGIMLQYGSIAWDLDDPETILKEVDEYLPIEPQKQLNRTWSTQTLLFWMRQPTAARKIFDNCDSGDLEELLATVRSIHRKFIEVTRGRYYEVWVRRPQHDIPMLISLFNACGLSEPWKYDTVNDVASLMNRAGVKSKDIDNSGIIQHNALSDCRFQLRCWAEANRRLG